MALTIALVPAPAPRGTGSYTSANKKVRTRLVTFDSSYVTGGLPLVPKDFGLKGIDFMVQNVAVSSGGGVNLRLISYDYTNQKLQAYSGATEVAATTDLSTFSVRLTFVGY